MPTRSARTRPVIGRRSPSGRPARRAAATVLLGGVLAAAGCNEFALRGEDEELPASVPIEERFQQAPLAAVDLLWVIDDTPSMESARQTLGAALVGALGELDALGLQWQVGVVSAALDDPALGVLDGQPWILRPGLAGAEDALLDTVTAGGGRDPTGGLGVAALALSPPLRDGANRGFRRPDAALQVIVVSDDDDQSEAILGDDPAGAFLDLLADEAAASGRAARLSAIVGAPGTGCSGVDGTALPGDRYAAVAAESGGLLGDVCTADLRAVVRGLGDLAVELPRSFPLAAAPIDGTLQVEVDGEPTGAWTLRLDPPELVLDAAPPAGAELRVSYRAAGEG
ncbi:MAG: hypothetical protein RL071_2346 [Pseudomonadota bacterium]